MMPVPWRSPVPVDARNSVHAYRPNADVWRVAADICERAWRGKGVRVYFWPCGTIANVLIGTDAERVLEQLCLPMLFATYARTTADGRPLHGAGPMLDDVVRELKWARARA